MCHECWTLEGSPANWTPQVAEAVALMRELYAIHMVGGPLHVAVDDWNIDGTIKPYYDAYDDAELDRLYSGGWPLDELPAEAPVVVNGEGRSLRQICDELAAKLNVMELADRYSVLAFHDGLATPPVTAEA